MVLNTSYHGNHVNNNAYLQMWKSCGCVCVYLRSWGSELSVKKLRNFVMQECSNYRLKLNVVHYISVFYHDLRITENWGF